MSRNNFEKQAKIRRKTWKNKYDAAG